MSEAGVRDEQRADEPFELQMWCSCEGQRTCRRRTRAEFGHLARAHADGRGRPISHARVTRNVRESPSGGNRRK